jgi:hypothetical protein
MPALICIDFGNTYTKVGIRPDPNSASVILEDASLTGFGELNIFIPTVAGRLEKNGKEQWIFGNDVQKYPRNTPGLTIYRNWKPLFFDENESLESTRELVEVVSNSSREAAGKNLPNDEWAVVKRILGLGEEDRALIEEVVARKKSVEHNGASPSQTDMDVKFVGRGFFEWLKNFVAPICQSHGFGKIERIPTRITLPSFGSVSKSELLLMELLEDAGWKLDKKSPTLSEPLANAIGTFSEGLNTVYKPQGSAKKSPNYASMFQNTGLLEVVRKAILSDGPKVSWVMIADLGGFTLDFAMVGLRLDDIDSRFGGTINGHPQIAKHSEAIGVTTLDKRVRVVLNPEKRALFEDLEKHPDQKLLESAHRFIYGKLRPIRLRNVTIGEGEEGRRIGKVIHQFSMEIAEYAEKFLQLYQYERIDDLVLTGGGMMIPSVRDILIEKLQSTYGIRKVHMYMPEGPAIQGTKHAMSQKLVRGATALGGASVYFDYAD